MNTWKPNSFAMKLILKGVSVAVDKQQFSAPQGLYWPDNSKKGDLC